MSIKRQTVIGKMMRAVQNSTLILGYSIDQEQSALVLHMRPKYSASAAVVLYGPTGKRIRGFSSQCAQWNYYTRKTRVLMRNGLSNVVISPAFLPGTGNRRADRGLRHREASAAVSRRIAATSR